MTTSHKLQAVGKRFDVPLDHVSVCAATGHCTCTRGEVARRVVERDGRVTTRYVRVRVAGVLSIEPRGETVVPDAVARLARVQRAIAAGRVIVLGQVVPER